jgi:hypothetical protein
MPNTKSRSVHVASVFNVVNRNINPAIEHHLAFSQTAVINFRASRSFL